LAPHFFAACSARDQVSVPQFGFPAAAAIGCGSTKDCGRAVPLLAISRPEAAQLLESRR